MSKSNQRTTRDHRTHPISDEAPASVETEGKAADTEIDQEPPHGDDDQPKEGQEGEQSLPQAGDQDGEQSQPEAAAEDVAASQRTALRTDTKIAARSSAAVKALTDKLGDVNVVELTDGIALAKEGTVRSAAKGVLFVAPGAYLVGPGNVEPSAKSVQHLMAVAALRKLQGDNPKGLVDLNALQRTYMDMGGTDLTIFTGRTRIFTNGGKAALVRNVPQAPLSVYVAPAPAVAPAVPSKAPAEASAETKAA